VAKVLPPITLNGVTYRVLRLNGSTRGPKFLLRNDAGDVFGLFVHNAQPTRLYAAPLVAASSAAHPLSRLDFFDSDGTLLVADVPPSAR
jgi:hypothetical protein